jgi:PleD family two-component response regulator
VTWPEACLNVGIWSIFQQANTPACAGAARDRVMDKLSGNILLVEDDEDLREATTKVLESAGFTVLVAPDHRKALDVLEGTSPCTYW